MKSRFAIRSQPSHRFPRLLKHRRAWARFGPLRPAPRGLPCPTRPHLSLPALSVVRHNVIEFLATLPRTVGSQHGSSRHSYYQLSAPPAHHGPAEARSRHRYAARRTERLNVSPSEERGTRYLRAANYT